MHGRESVNRLVRATTEMQRKVQTLKKPAGIMCERGQKQGRSQKLGRITKLLFSILKRDLRHARSRMSCEDGSVMRNLCSILTFGT